MEIVGRRSRVVAVMAFAAATLVASSAEACYQGSCPRGMRESCIRTPSPNLDQSGDAFAFGAPDSIVPSRVFGDPPGLAPGGGAPGGGMSGFPTDSESFGDAMPGTVPGRYSDFRFGDSLTGGFERPLDPTLPRFPPFFCNNPACVPC